MITLSRVGFSKDHTLALLDVSSGIRGMAASGELYLCELKENKWVVKTAIPTWTT